MANKTPETSPAPKPIEAPTSSNEKLIEEITKETSRWMNLISGDHHKDRDCHFYVGLKWSYGDPPRYEAWHHGYVGKRFDETYPTYEAALNGLLQFVKEAIREEEKWRSENE